MKKNLVWKKDYGTGEETDDSVLWVNGKPTDTVISGWNGCWFLMKGNTTLYTGATKKECKIALEDCR